MMYGINSNMAFIESFIGAVAERKTSLSRTGSSPWPTFTDQKNDLTTCHANKRWSATEELIAKVTF